MSLARRGGEGGASEKLLLVTEGGQLGVGHNSRLKTITRGKK